MTQHMSSEEGRRALAKRAGKQPESIILAQVRDWLRWKGWYVIRIQQGMGAHKGMSDLVCIRDGETVYVECKTKTGKQSARQQAFQTEIENHGARYFLTRGIEDLEEVLR